MGKQLLKLGGAVGGVIVAAFAVWHFWLEERYVVSSYRYNDLVSIYELKTHPAKFLNKPIVLRGYMHWVKYIEGGDVLLYPNETEAKLKNLAVAVQLAYPIDGKIVCDNAYVEVSGIFEMIPRNIDNRINEPIHGVGHIDYLGKIEDTYPLPGYGLQRPSCPSNMLPEDFGVGTFR